MRRIQVLALLAAALPAWCAQPVRARHAMVVAREAQATRVGLDRFPESQRIFQRSGKFYWLPGELQMEPGFSPDTADLLESRGCKIKRVSAQGEAAAILFANGWLEGAPDRRAESTAQGY